MLQFPADGKIRIGMLCFSMFLYCPLSSYGAPRHQPPDQAVVSDIKESTPVSPPSKPPFVKSPVKNEKKKALKEGVKVAHPGPPPENVPKAKGLAIPLTPRPQNPVDLSTGKELTPWTDDITPKVPAAK